MELNKDCDVTQTCLLAQRAGAKAMMFIHNANSNGNIHLPKQGLYKDSIRIPVFCVGKETGKDISALLPSKAGIKTRTPPPNQSAVVNTNDQTNTTMLTEKQVALGELSSIQSEQTAADLLNGSGFGKQGFSVSPNPTRNQANVSYQFQNPTDVTIEAKTASGQVIFSRILRGATVGNVEIPTVDYPNGTYFVTLQYGKEVRTKKLVVRD